MRSDYYVASLSDAIPNAFPASVPVEFASPRACWVHTDASMRRMAGRAPGGQVIGWSLWLRKAGSGKGLGSTVPSVAVMDSARGRGSQR